MDPEKQTRLTALQTDITKWLKVWLAESLRRGGDSHIEGRVRELCQMHGFELKASHLELPWTVVWELEGVPLEDGPRFTV